MMGLLNERNSPIPLLTEAEPEYAILGQERRDRGDVEEVPEHDHDKRYYLGWASTIKASENRSDGCCVKCCCFYSFFGMAYLTTVAILLQKQYFYAKVEGAELSYSTAELAEPVKSTAVMFFVVLMVTLAMLCYRWKRRL